MYLFTHQIALRRNLLTNIREFIKFIAKVHVPSWYESTSSNKSALNDLKLIKRIIEYEIVNKKMSVAALNSFSRHLWCLSETLVAMAFFDERIDESEKLKMFCIGKRFIFKLCKKTYAGERRGFVEKYFKIL